MLQWVVERYSDLMNAHEHAFIEQFTLLPQSSRALLVRMVMRKGELFRTGKLRYDEIGCPRRAAVALIGLGWLDEEPLLALDQLFVLLNKTEIAERFGALLKPGTKADQLLQLRGHFGAAETFNAWLPQSTECVYQLRITPLCNRLRLMFFGNLRQDWSEFVLADLGIYRYEKVEFSALSRGFHTRCDVDAYLHLYDCRVRLEQGEPAEDIFSLVPEDIYPNAWLESRRAKLLFHIAQHYERAGVWPWAYAIYSVCSHSGSRIRAVRMLERCGQFEAALQQTQNLDGTGVPDGAGINDADRQQLSRITARLRRKLALPQLPVTAAAPLARLDLLLPRPDTVISVEETVGNYLGTAHEPVYYVENTLVNSLFGLLCWPAIFLPLPGAFFHPFHSGPADLLSADFYPQRRQPFADCLSQLDTPQYKDTIVQRFRDKFGLQSPFVFWEILTEELITLALDCIPAAHLKKWFERMLLDLSANRAGWPDLIRFWPRQQRYQMIEVKGPGDRLQDNQQRWLAYFTAHEMPVAVCYVQWAEQ